MEPIKSNLEPIDEKDLDLREKLKGGEVGVGEFGAEEEVFKVEKEVSQEKAVAEKDNAYSQIMSKLQDNGTGSDIDASVVSDDAQKVSEKTDADSQIQHLVDIAMTKGVVHAVKVAKHIDDNYVLDTFHDKLMAEGLHDALVEKGLLKNM
ncbi:MAG: hypothetical protein UY41_C0002G0012 [Candidatus Moranbacteria bacterium GW2011_GWE1_49_15]|nr:MAG: hypothetical protein UX75_C0003G0011 [Candidatus Moranbacteria bacterium GW2011_GWE2_47_10]KKW07495.1 MAG: hypothetical protein UY41_C0002G0012 [Candidatus Moranbacteria bacterium GW2011_GWE1_49_15]HBP01273.1 hypothetical protein [Candidatus Moranbacteria bacterium]